MNLTARKATKFYKVNPSSSGNFLSFPGEVLRSVLLGFFYQSFAPKIGLTNLGQSSIPRQNQFKMSGSDPHCQPAPAQVLPRAVVIGCLDCFSGNDLMRGKSSGTEPARRNAGGIIPSELST